MMANYSVLPTDYNVMEEIYYIYNDFVWKLSPVKVSASPFLSFFSLAGVSMTITMLPGISTNASENYVDFLRLIHF